MRSFIAPRFHGIATKQCTQHAMRIPANLLNGITLWVVMLMCSTGRVADKAQFLSTPIRLELHVPTNTILQYQFTTRLQGTITIGNDERVAPLDATVHTRMRVVIQRLVEGHFAIGFKDVQSYWTGRIAGNRIQATLPAEQMDMLPMAPFGLLPSTIVRNLQFIISSNACLKGLMNSVRIGKYQCSTLRIVTQGHRLPPRPIRLNDKWQYNVIISSIFNPKASCQMNTEYQLTDVEGKADARSVRIAYRRRVTMSKLHIAPNASRAKDTTPKLVIIIDELAHTERGWLLRNLKTGIAHSGASSGQLHARCKVWWIGIESRTVRRVIKLDATTNSTFECAS